MYQSSLIGRICLESFAGVGALAARARAVVGTLSKASRRCSCMLVAVAAPSSCWASSSFIWVRRRVRSRTFSTLRMKRMRNRVEQLMLLRMAESFAMLLVRVIQSLPQSATYAESGSLVQLVKRAASFLLSSVIGTFCSNPPKVTNTKLMRRWTSSHLFFVLPPKPSI